MPVPETIFDSAQPVWVVNGFIWHELKKMSPKFATWYPSTIPFFPINDSTAGTSQWQGKPYFIYNEATRIEHSFYEIKKSTFVYSMRTDVGQTIPLANALKQILDRGDDAAQDLNDYNEYIKTNEAVKHCPGLYFHSIDLYQNEPGKPRDGASPPYVISNFMVVAKYHVGREQVSWTP